MISRLVYMVGAVLGIWMSSVLSLVYNGRQSWVGVSITDIILSTPRSIIVAPPIVGLIVAVVAHKLRYEQIAIPVCFRVGSVLGAIGGLMLFGLSPFPGRGFFSHLVSGILIGGAIGSMTPFIAFRLVR